VIAQTRDAIHHDGTFSTLQNKREGDFLTSHPYCPVADLVIAMPMKFHDRLKKYRPLSFQAPFIARKRRSVLTSDRKKKRRRVRSSAVMRGKLGGGMGSVKYPRSHTGSRPIRDLVTAAA